MVQAHLDRQIWGNAAFWLQKEVLPALACSVEVLPSLPLRHEEGRVRLVAQQAGWKSWLPCLEGGGFNVVLAEALGRDLGEPFGEVCG